MRIGEEMSSALLRFAILAGATVAFGTSCQPARGPAKLPAGRKPGSTLAYSYQSNEYQFVRSDREGKLSVDPARKFTLPVGAKTISVFIDPKEHLLWLICDDKKGGCSLYRATVDLTLKTVSPVELIHSMKLKAESVVGDRYRAYVFGADEFRAVIMVPGHGWKEAAAVPLPDAVNPSNDEPVLSGNNLYLTRSDTVSEWSNSKLIRYHLGPDCVPEPKPQVLTFDSASRGITLREDKILVCGGMASLQVFRLDDGVIGPRDATFTFPAEFVIGASLSDADVWKRGYVSLSVEGRLYLAASPGSTDLGFANDPTMMWTDEAKGEMLVCSTTPKNDHVVSYLELEPVPRVVSSLTLDPGFMPALGSR
jgi:hypothetical protein